MDTNPLMISLKTAVSATCITFFLGIYAARMTLRMKRFQAVVDTIFTLPMVLPPTVIGFFLLVFFGKNSGIGAILGKIGVQIVFTWVGAMIAATVVAFPIMYRTSRGAFEQLDPNIIHAARTLGLGETKIFYQIILPNCWRGILAGTILAFARALGEFGATIMLAGNIPGKTQTLSVAVYTAVQNGNRTLAYQWVAVIVTISFLSILLMNSINAGRSSWFRRRR